MLIRNTLCPSPTKCTHRSLCYFLGNTPNDLIHCINERQSTLLIFSWLYPRITLIPRNDVVQDNQELVALTGLWTYAWNPEKSWVWASWLHPKETRSRLTQLPWSITWTQAIQGLSFRPGHLPPKLLYQKLKTIFHQLISYFRSTQRNSVS